MSIASNRISGADRRSADLFVACSVKNRDTFEAIVSNKIPLDQVVRRLRPYDFHTLQTVSQDDVPRRRSRSSDCVISSSFNKHALLISDVARSRGIRSDKVANDLAAAAARNNDAPAGLNSLCRADPCEDHRRTIPRNYVPRSRRPTANSGRASSDQHTPEGI